MLQILNLNSYYGASQILRQVDLRLDQGKILCLFGRNGAGKTTLLKSIMGLVNHTGTIQLNNQTISTLPAHLRPAKGIGYVPQGRRLFAQMSVLENIEIGLSVMKKDVQPKESILQELFRLFPLLKSRLNQNAGTLSGGEQQMLAMARALSLCPCLLLLDEPTEGLMPRMIETIRSVIMKLKHQGVSVILVEQRVEAVVQLADEVVIMENGRIQVRVTSSEIQQDISLLKKYVGV